jgi:2-polyprenyl-3-methyl-5-hydroxy-6-metoxy-1,4-benzoquinol methylase
MPLLTSRAQMHRGGERFTFLRCRRCGLVYLSPRVAPSALGEYYEASYLPHRGAAAWGRFAPLAAEGQRRTDSARVRRARQAMRLGPETAVLDLGCGRPTFLEALSRTTGARGTGIDRSDAGWADDSARWAAAGLTLALGTVEDGLPAGPFDLITLWHALEHDYQPLDTLRRLREVARPGGALIVEVPNFDSLTRRLHGSEWAGFHTPRHSAIYTPATLRALLEKAGWTIERQDAHGTLDPYVLWWLGRQERRGRSLDGDLERAFPGFMLGKILTLPIALAQRWMSLGVQVAVGRAPGRAGGAAG